MTICGGLQRWSSKLAGCGMLAQRSIGGSEKMMSCAVASIANQALAVASASSNVIPVSSAHCAASLGRAKHPWTPCPRIPSHAGLPSVDFLLLFSFFSIRLVSVEHERKR